MEKKLIYVPIQAQERLPENEGWYLCSEPKRETEFSNFYFQGRFCTGRKIDKWLEPQTNIVISEDEFKSTMIEFLKWIRHNTMTNGNSEKIYFIPSDTLVTIEQLYELFIQIKVI